MTPATHTKADVLSGVPMKTLPNYTNHIAETPLNERFGGYPPQPLMEIQS
jgi:hypothetical protein